MEKSETTFTELLALYFSGEASAEDIRILSGLVGSDPARKLQFEEYRRTWTLMEEAQIAGKVNPDQEWDDFQAAKAQRQTHSLENRKGFHFGRILRIAAVVGLLLVPAWFIWQYATRPEQILVSAKSGTLETLLPDGSRVTLNKGAMLAYPASFTGNTRQVVLTGQACFEVSREVSKPFIVQTGNVRVEVLGTVFYVSAGADKDFVSVILASGSVVTYFKGDKEHRVLLEPGEAAELSVSHHAISKHLVNDPNLTAWKTRRMVFENATLQEIVGTLNEVYEARITLADPRLAGCRVTATFDRQSLESVLTVLQATVGFTLSRTAEGIILSGTVCE